jgi:hypothetical protein
MATQAHTLANQAAPTHKSGKDAIVVIPSALQLDIDQETKLMQHVRSELTLIKQEMGRDEFSDDSGISTSPDVLNRSGASFFGRRHLSHLVYHQQMQWRPQVMGGIYAHTNVHLPITARILSQQIARANKSFFGTHPYFAVSATQSAVDEGLARDINAWARHNLETDSQLSHHLSAGVELTFVQGESVIKTSKYKLTSFFQSYRTIHIDPATQEPFVAADGDYIYETDTFPPVMEPIVDEATGQPVLDPATGESATRQKVDALTGQPLYALSRDGVTPKPAQFNFETHKISLAQVLANHVKSRPIYYLDFLCRLKETDVQSAATIAHLYDAPIIELCHRLLNEMFAGQPPEEKLARVAQIAAALLPGSTMGGSTSEGAAADRARPELGEVNEFHNRQQSEPTKELAEVWLWYDVFGDGVMRSIMVLTDAQGNIPVYYDYAANVTHDGQRPFDVLRINPVTNRWYGMGNVEKFWDLQATADLILNRAFFSQSRAGRIDFVQKDAIVSGDVRSINWGGTVELANGKTAKDAFESVYLQDNKTDTLRGMLEIVLQAAQSMSSVANVNDANMAGMDSQKLATGIKNLERSGEELFGIWLFHLTPCIENVIKRNVGVLLDKLPTDKQRIIRFFDRVTSRLIELDPALLADIALDAKLELTSYKSQSQLTQAQMGYNMALGFLGIVNPVWQKRLRPLVNQFLRALEILNVDDITAEYTPEEQQMLALMPPPPPGPGGIPNVADPAMNQAA